MRLRFHAGALTALMATALLAAGCGSESASDSGATSAKQGGELVVAAFGGTYGEAEQAAYLDPFARDSGVKVRPVQAEASLAAVKLQVDKHNVLWDIVELAPPDLETGCREGTLERLDPKVVDTSGLDEDSGYDCGILSSLYTEGIGYDTTKVKTPPTWADFFDTTKIPGKRTMETYLQDGTLEHASLGAGTALDALYPVDVDKALEQMRSLGDDLILVDSLAQASQLLTSGDAVMVQTAVGRILPLKAAGLNVDFVPNGQRGASVFAIPKGAPHREQAMQFLAYIAQCAPCSTEMAKRTAYSGPNAKGNAQAPASVRDLLPSNPKIRAQTFFPDVTWWVANAKQAQLAFERADLAR